MSPAPARTATVDQHGQIGLTPLKSPSTQSIAGGAGTSSPLPASGFSAASLGGLVVTGLSDAITTQQAVEAQSSLLAKFETALTAVFDFVPPLVAVADPAAATLVTGIGNGVSAILAAVRNHAATTTAVPGGTPTAAAAPALAPAPTPAPTPTTSPGSTVLWQAPAPTPGNPPAPETDPAPATT